MFDDNQKIKLKLKKKIIKLEQIQKINFDKIIISPGTDILETGKVQITKDSTENAVHNS